MSMSTALLIPYYGHTTFALILMSCTYTCSREKGFLKPVKMNHSSFIKVKKKINVIKQQQRKQRSQTTEKHK